MNEQMLYEYVRDKYVPDLEKSGDAFEYIDATSDQYRMKIELKCRQTHYDELILEKDKYDSLIQQSKKLGYTPFYINSTLTGCRRVVHRLLGVVDNLFIAPYPTLNVLMQLQIYHP